MMELTRKTEYAIRGMLHLARLPEGEIAMAADIARAEGVPRTFLAKIFQGFIRAGLVRSTRGSRGGFMLAKAPAQITLREIVEAVEGPILPNRCVMGEGVCPLSKTCTVHPVWRRVQASVRGILDEVTLQTLVRER
jgi:Rrf2 family transcriptional regulator, iron-sulfur cluster assembly transcription factor